MKKIKFCLRKPFSLMTAFLLLASCNQPAAVQGVVPQPTSTPFPTATPAPTEIPVPEGYVEYFSQSGDTLEAVAAHFGVDPEGIILADLESAQYLINDEMQEELHIANIYAETSSLLDVTRIVDPGTRMFVPDVLDKTTSSELLFPDSDVVYSPSAVGFDIHAFVQEQGGFLAEHEDLLSYGMTPASEIIQIQAEAHSINPRILLSVMEYESGWVRGQPETDTEKRYPMGWEWPDRSGIIRQTSLIIRETTIGYYSWRNGSLTELEFMDGGTIRLSPYLNAGTVGVMYALSRYHTQEEWLEALYGEYGIPQVHEALFGDAWERAAVVEPLFPAGIRQPEMNFPFSPNEVWSHTCGPHAARIANPDLPPAAALDFAPTAGGPGCNTSSQWATAAAGGLVTSSPGGGPVFIDMDMDAYNQTGWVLFYNHIGNSERVMAGTILEMDDPVGHPCCVGHATGTHIHIARLYNGEWVLADGGIPFVFVITANTAGNYYTRSIRPDSDPEYFYTPTPRN